MRKGVCCIVSSLADRKDNPIRFNTITYARFSSMDRKEAVASLSSRILNNMLTTYHYIKYCADHNHTYRISSDLFPLITYDKANVKLEDLPDYTRILASFDSIKKLIQSTGVRISSHPSVEFISLDSEKYEVAINSAKDLNMHSWFQDKIGLPQDYSNPINIHIKNEKRNLKDVCDLFMERFNSLLDEGTKKRIVLENNDKPNSQWNVKNLYETFYVYCEEKYNHKFPITFDYLHNLCCPSFEE